MLATAWSGCLLVFPEEQPAPETRLHRPPVDEPVCTGSLANCDGSASNGCESDLASDPSHCGACDVACDPGAACNDSACGSAPEVIASGQLSPTRLVATDGDLFWVHAVQKDPASGSTFGVIQHLPRDASESRLFFSGRGAPESLAVNATHVYWPDYDGGRLLRMTRHGLPRLPEPLTSGLRSPRSLTIVGDTLFWASAPDRTAYRCSPSSCQPTAFAVLPDAVTGVAASPSGVFVAGTTTVLRLDPSGHIATTLASSRSGPFGLIAAESSAFWIEQGGPGLRDSGLIAGADPGFQVLAEAQDGPSSIAVDDGWVYWTNLLAGTVMRAPRQGGKALPLAVGQGQPSGIAIDDHSVYWTTRETGRVMRLPKDK